MTKSEKNAIARGGYPAFDRTDGKYQSGFAVYLGLIALLKRGRRGVERDSVSFGIDHHCAKTMLADLLARSQDLSAIGAGRLYCFIQTPLDQEINQRPVR